MRTTLSTLMCAILLMASPALPAEKEGSFPGIEALMTPQEYEAAGLNKLSPAERGALNSFLIRYTAEDAQVMMNTDEEVKQAREDQETLSVLLEPFEGWTGNTVFRLENGQVWQQRYRGNYYYRGPAPKVRITKNFMGFYRLELVENGKAVGVKRIK